MWCVLRLALSLALPQTDPKSQSLSTLWKQSFEIINRRKSFFNWRTQQSTNSISIWAKICTPHYSIKSVYYFFSLFFCIVVVVVACMENNTLFLLFLFWQKITLNVRHCVCVCAPSPSLLFWITHYVKVVRSARSLRFSFFSLTDWSPWSPTLSLCNALSLAIWLLMKIF